MKLIVYGCGTDHGQQAAKIDRWASNRQDQIVGYYNDLDRPKEGLIEAVRAASVHGAALAVTSYDRLSPEPVHVALLGAVVRIVVAA